LKFFRKLVPFLLFSVLALWLGSTRWPGFYIIFGWIAVALLMGKFVEKKNDPTFARRITILFIMPMFIVFLGILQRENLQLEETVFYTAYFISAGIFTRVLIHFLIAKVGGPLIFGRGFCGWACWTAAILEWLPIKENRKIPKKLTLIRIPIFILSLAIPFLLIKMGYDYYQTHIHGTSKVMIQNLKYSQLIWFLTGNALYYVVAIGLAFVFKKKRAFCKIACPVSLVMKLPSRLSLLKVKPSGKPCLECGKCNDVCPMDVDVMEYIKKGRPIVSTECIHCNNCKYSCPAQAIS
jgi:polyferredoxin